MIGALDLFTRTAKKYYEEAGNLLLAGKQGIDTFLFPVDDMDTVANFTLDSLIVNPYAARFRHKDAQSNVRSYEPGVGTVKVIPHISEKTPISENLRDSVAAGIESTAGISQHDAKLMSDIVNQHVAAHTVTRWKAAIDTIRTGIFTARGTAGADLGLDIDFARLGALDITYDFTAVGATIDQALLELYDAYLTAGGNPDEVCIIAGQSWISAFQTDSSVRDLMKANAANVLVRQSMMPPSLKNTQGLYLIAEYLIPGTMTPVYICGFRPRYNYLSTKGGTEENFMPADEAVIFSLPDPRYRVFRGVDAFDTGGNVIRTVGELIFDGFKTFDPIEENIRSQSRWAMIPANANRTGRSTGTFPAVS